MIPPVAASDRGEAQTVGVLWRRRGCRGACARTADRTGTGWKAGPQRVTAPYGSGRAVRWRHLSSAGHVKPCANQPGPSGKAKYSWETDSEPVP